MIGREVPCAGVARKKAGPATRNADRAARKLAPISGKGREPRRCIPGGRAEARPPVRQKLYCEALAGVADPKTTWPGEVVASTQEGG